MKNSTTTADDWRNRPTLGVEEAGRVLGISRVLAYQAVRSGELPSISIGRRILVPTVELRRMLRELPAEAQ